jgi:peptidoglycan-associated lipoprotein
MHTKLSVLVALASALALASCSDEAPPKSANDAAADAASKSKGKGDGKSGKGDKLSENASAVKIDDRIVSACGDLPSARFAFDSDDVGPDAANALDALARCFISGPLKGKGIKLVGHADPRGETEYNLALGQRRSGAVSDYLAKKGLEPGRISTSSKGEFEATGTDEDGWAKDRKVEILLAD